MLYVPKINQNIVSVGQWLESGYSLSFNDGMCNARNKMGILLLSTKMMNRSFNIDWEEACLSVNTCIYTDFVLWHKILRAFQLCYL